MTSDPSRSAASARMSVVVPAGGAGTRLWPLSTRERPKFLLDMLGTGRSLLQETVARLSPLAERTLVVTGVAHVSQVRAQLPELGDREVVAEPVGRDSMAAIGLAAALLERRHGPHVFGSFAADQVVRDPGALVAAVRIAIAAAEAGDIATIGIEPTFAATGFGWIERGEPLSGVDGAWRVGAFKEKPDVPTAEAYLADGAHLWNAGMFVARTDVLLGHLEQLRPELHAGLRAIAAAWDGDSGAAAMETMWPSLERIAIDHAIAEPVAAAGGVAVVPCECGWIDVGDFAVLASLLEAGEDGIVRLGHDAPVAALDATGAMVVGGERPVVIVGLDDVTVVDTPDAILVLGRGSAQRVKDASEAVG